MYILLNYLIKNYNIYAVANTDIGTVVNIKVYCGRILRYFSILYYYFDINLYDHLFTYDKYRYSNRSHDIRLDKIVVEFVFRYYIII